MDNLQNTCVSCLSKNRRLMPVSKLNSILQQIQFYELNQSQGGLCWECSRIIVRYYKFKLQCKEVQKLLAEYSEQTNIKCFSNLISTTKLCDYEFIHTFDPLEEDQSKSQIKLIKEETNNDDGMIHQFDDQNGDENIDDNIDNNIYIETKTHNKKRKMNSIKPKIDKRMEGDFEEKFEVVEFSEEEMLRNKEEKRNQPNFKKIPFKCDSCVLGFMSREKFELHLEKKHNKNVGNHLCPVCETRFPNAKSAERHKKKHYVWYRCRLCRYDAGELWSAVNHCRDKHRDDTKDRIHCAQCDFVVKTPEDLAEHIKIEHTLHCNECGEKFKGKHTLRTHKTRIHAVKREFLCDLCKKSFMTKTRLESHMVTHNSVIAKKLAYCAVCDVQYKNIYVYRNHLKNSANHSERSYSCPECNKKFASKVYWTKHYNFYHLHKSQYHCDICTKYFISDWRLKNHNQKHHGLSRSRDHTCNVCGKKFYTLSTLRGHQLTHSEERSYMCEDCGDTFKQRPALYTHSRLVHKAGIKKK